MSRFTAAFSAFQHKFSELSALLRDSGVPLRVVCGGVHAGCDKEKTMNRRQVLTSATAAVLLTPVGTAGKAQGAPQTFVLVAGAFSGGWIWSRVVHKLRSAGHTVYAPSNTGLAERAHLLSPGINLETFAKDIAGVIEAEELSDVVLVGHSFGGIPVSGAAELVASRVKHLVYLDALVVQPGKSAFDGLPAEVVAARKKAAQETSGGLSLPVPPPAAFADLGVTQDADVAWLKRRFTPHPLGAYDSPLIVKNPIGNGLPRTYVACTNPVFSPANPSKAWVKQQAGWNWIEIPTGHLPMVTAPDLLVQTLIKLAGA
jgi:pimeloyl-ACP methyl ester carboxylesterase